MNSPVFSARYSTAGMTHCLCVVAVTLSAACAENDPFDPTDGSGNVADFDAVGIDVIVPPPDVPTCDNACDTRYATRCTGPNTIEVCDDFNADGCTEWGDNRPCRAGYLCEDDVCYNPNSPPTTSALALTTDEDTPLEIVLAADDPDDQRLRFELTSRPEHGAISGVVPTLTYIPDPDFNGTDTIRFAVTDRLSEPVLGEVTITVNPVNDDPVFQSASFNLTEDTALPISVPATDADGDELTWTLLDTPTLFTLQGEGPDFIIEPLANASGEETIAFRVEDTAADAPPAELRVRIAPVNDAPTAESFNVSLPEDTQIEIMAITEDVDSENVSIFVLLPPAHGELIEGAAPGNWTYVPEDDYFGPDQFSYTIDDGRLTAAPAIVSIDVTPVADAPVAGDYTLTLAEDTTARLTLRGSDVDLDALTFAIIVEPAEGVLTGAGRERVYAPADNFFGEDLLRYAVTDGDTTVEGAVAITVTPVNDLPSLSDQSLVLGQDTSIEFELDGTDLESSALSYFVDQPVQHGVITGMAPTFRYVPDPGYFGPDSVTVRVLDESGGSATAVISFDVRPVGQAPVVTSTLFTITEDVPRTLQLTANDGDTPPAELEWTVINQPTRGTLTGTPPELTYTPGEDLNGPDSFTVRVTDGLFDSGEVVVTLNIAPVNDPPLAFDAEYTIDEDGAVDIVLAASDIDNDPLSYEIVSPPSGGVLTGSGRNRRFTPAHDASGTFRFTWRAVDASIASTIARVTVRVNPVNDRPTLSVGTLVVDEDDSITGAIAGFDAESTPLDYRLDTPPEHGDLTGVLPDFTYTPHDDYFGADSFVVIANDREVDSEPLTASITVTAINDPPTLTGFETTTLEDTDVTIVLAATDVDGDRLTIEVQDPFILGTWDGDAEGGTYSPDDNLFGLDIMRLNVTDGTLDSETVEVRVTITSVEDRPTAEPLSIDIIEDGSEPFQLIGTDGDMDPITYRITTFDPGLNLQVDTDTGAGTLLLDPDVNGTLMATFVTNDGDEDSLPATITVNVTADNDPPVVTANTLAISEDTPVDFEITGTDADGDELTFSLDTPPSHGQLTGTMPNLTYTPDLNYFGADSFTVTAFDGTVNSDITTIAIEIIANDDAPVGTDQTFDVFAGYTVTDVLAATDVEGDTFRFVLQTPPALGSVDLSLDGSFTYTANPGGANTDSFSFIAKQTTTPTEFFVCTTAGASIPQDWQCDGIDDCADGSDEPSPACDEPTRLPVFSEEVATITLNIQPPPALGAVADSSPYYGNTPLQLQTAWLLENDTDALSRTPVFSAASMTTTGGGTVGIAGGVLTYTPPASNPATDTWNYTLTASDGTTADTSITFTRATTVHYFRGGTTAGTGTLASPRNTLGTSAVIGGAGDIMVVLPPETPAAQLAGRIRLTTDQRVIASSVGLEPLTAFGRSVATNLPAGNASTIAVGADSAINSSTGDLGSLRINGLVFDGGPTPTIARPTGYSIIVSADSYSLDITNVGISGYARLVSASNSAGDISVSVTESTIDSSLIDDRSINIGTGTSTGDISMAVTIEDNVFVSYREAVRVNAQNTAAAYISIQNNLLQSARTNSEFADIRIQSSDTGDGATIELVDNGHDGAPVAGTFADIALDVTFDVTNIAPLCLTASGNVLDGVAITNPTGSNLTVTSDGPLASWRDTVNTFTTFSVAPAALIFNANANCYLPR